MGSGASSFGPQDGQYMIYNNYPYNKSRSKPMSEEERFRRDPTGEKERSRLEIRQRELISREYYEKKGYNYK